MRKSCVSSGANFVFQKTGSRDGLYVWAEIGAAWVRRIPIVALLLGITPTELQTRPGIPVLLKKRDLLELNDVEIYLKQLGARVRQGEG